MYIIDQTILHSREIYVACWTEAINRYWTCKAMAFYGFLRNRKIKIIKIFADLNWNIRTVSL